MKMTIFNSKNKNNNNNRKVVNFHNVYLSLFTLLSLLFLSCNNVLAQKSCFTPNMRYGHCIPYEQCDYLTQLFQKYGGKLPQELNEYIRNSRCQQTTDSQRIHICCVVSMSRPTMTPTIATTQVTEPPQQALSNNGNSDANYEASLNVKGLQKLRQMKCGQASTNRVAYGEETGVFEFPWVALLRYDTPEQEYKCGGSLITDRYVLTAAHCMVGITDTLIGVRLGEHDLDTVMDCEKRGNQRVCAGPIEDYGIEKLIPHPQYSSTKILNDVALIKLDGVVEFKKHIKPVCLPITPRSRERLSDDEYFIAGFGTTEEGTTSRVLLKAKIPNKDNSVCQNTYKRTPITENHICAGGDGRVDSCKGDSGGPLFLTKIYEKAPRYVQYGIVSFGGVKCGVEKTFPGLYSNVMDLLPWITENID